MARLSFVNITAFLGRTDTSHGGKTSGPERQKVGHSGKQSLCHITSAWEWVKQGADRQGSVGILTWAKKGQG